MIFAKRRQIVLNQLYNLDFYLFYDFLKWITETKVTELKISLKHYIEIQKLQKFVNSSMIRIFSLLRFVFKTLLVQNFTNVNIKGLKTF